MKIWNQNDLRDTLDELIENSSTYDVVQAIIDALEAKPPKLSASDDTDKGEDTAKLDAEVLREILNQLH